MVTGSQSRVGSGPEFRVITDYVHQQYSQSQCWSNELVEFEIWPLKFKTAGKLPVILEEPMEYISKLTKKNTERSQYVTG